MRPRRRHFPEQMRPRRLPPLYCIVNMLCIMSLIMTILSHSSLSESFSRKFNAIFPTKAESYSPEIFLSPEIFERDYAEMESNFKVFVYPDGDDSPETLTGKYASEGFFFKNIKESRFLTDDPHQAHLFFIPISCLKLRAKGYSFKKMEIIVQKYVESLISKYPYWNRTLGADHFFITCHEIGLNATKRVPDLAKNSIRAVCSPNNAYGYIRHKDFTLPKILMPSANPQIRHFIRPILGFWDGVANSEIRSALKNAWGNDSELLINNNNPLKKINRTRITEPVDKFNASKFCICPRDSHFSNGRIAKSIHHGCIPVIMSDHCDLPFFDVLDWSKFSVVVKESDVYQLKKILKNISYYEVRALLENTLKARKHFEWKSPPIKYDTFHMVMYELWLRHHVSRTNISPQSIAVQETYNTRQIEVHSSALQPNFQWQ